MSDYYIRTPEQDESRGPFDVSKLNTLAEAGQVTANTLYYDEEKEEWIPIALNPELHAQVFPQREKLSLRIGQGTPKAAAKAPAEPPVKVEAMLAAAEGDTAEKRKLVRRRKSLERAASIAAVGLGVMLLLSALSLILPVVPSLSEVVDEKSIWEALNYPSILVGLFDLLMGVLLLLSVTEIYPLLRARAMLGLGFGAYVGWAIGDPALAGLAVAAYLGIFLATMAQRMSTLIFAFLLGIGGQAALAYLALSGRFDGFFEHIVFNLVD